MSWKDEWRDEKDESGLTWDEFHERQFVHVSELSSATRTLEQLDKHVRACANEYREMKRELHEVRVLLESEEFDP
jgi:hypothetical protein